MNGLDVFIYLRKSRKDEEEDNALFDTLERHRRQLFAIAKENRYNILGVFEEVVSGEFIDERPRMKELLNHVSQGAVDAVLVMDVDRLGRGDQMDQGMIYRAFTYSETKIITPTETLDPMDESFELLFGIKSLFSRQELRTINKRLMRGRKESAKDGKHIASRPPFAYNRDKDLRLTIDKDKAWVVESIFNWAIEGIGRLASSKKLNEMGIPSPSGANWSITSIRNILQNDVYYGAIVWQKAKHKKINGKYIRKVLPRDEWIIKEDAHEGIVTKEVFLLANKLVSDRYIPPVKKTSNGLFNPLAGILFCESCGRSVMRVCTYRNKVKKETTSPATYLKCTNSSCKKTKVSKYELVEKAIIDSLHEILYHFEMNKQYDLKIDETAAYEKARRKREKDLSDLQKQKDSLHDFLEKGVYTTEIFLERHKRLSDKESQINSDIQTLNKEIDRIKESQSVRENFAPKLSSVLEAYYETDDVEKKNRLLKSVLEKATYYRDVNSTEQDDFTIQLYTKL